MGGRRVLAVARMGLPPLNPLTNPFIHNTPTRTTQTKGREGQHLAHVTVHSPFTPPSEPLSECLVSLIAPDCLARIRSWMRDSRAYLGASWAGPPVTSAQQACIRRKGRRRAGAGYAIREQLASTLERVGLAAVDQPAAKLRRAFS